MSNNNNKNDDDDILKQSSGLGHYDRPQVAILDFGSQYTHLIARRIRELNVYCELYNGLVSYEELSKHTNIIGIILSGGPSSVYDTNAPHVHTQIWTELIAKQENRKKKKATSSSNDDDTNTDTATAEGDGCCCGRIPVLGICYGLQEIAYTFEGGVVEPGLKHEYGKADVTLCSSNSTSSPLFHGMTTNNNNNNKQEEKKYTLWMSHGDHVQTLPMGFHEIAYTNNIRNVVIEDIQRKIWGVQFHPEVTHSSPYGEQIIRNFIIHICNAQQTWTMKNHIHTIIHDIRQQVGPMNHVIGAISGGVDSTVAAVLLNKAIGPHRFHAIMIDNGCLRKDESIHVIDRLHKKCGVNIQCIDSSKHFLSLLSGIIDPEEKRKMIGKTFIDIFQQEAKKIEMEIHNTNNTTTSTNTGDNNNNNGGGKCEFLLQGTLYPDVIESISYKGPSATIKTHHNVGGLPATMKLKLIEPLRELFKDEVRKLGLELGIDRESIYRHPFPGPGLAIRILGEVTAEHVSILQHADSILIEELHRTKHYDKIGQAFVVLLPTIRSVGVMGDNRTYDMVAAIRCVQTVDYMTADFYHLPHDIMAIISSRIINEVRGINRVCYDISSKPPATIEWE